ncbi:thioredoxin-disulfide reductase [Botrimarina hoheduenensis]|uniref:Thioredoxin reductase n=1 Tax=Botrimarina hoheduenensis TaxID=2528000 RepID=A0A5C5W8V9_9BACT|nr:thioredoxin-disulfide reductase [Botrimarina hoheduenensis]TWT47326.1 Thioredoxin reductase [Botrimarina hoheduenensis]
MPEHVVIIGSGPAGWTAAVYAARANLHPLVFEGAITEDNRQSGTLPLGQLALTTEVENFPGWPAGDLSGYLRSALDEEHHWLADMHQGEGCSGPELMHLMRQQAKNFGTRILTDDVVDVDFSTRPFKIRSRDNHPETGGTNELEAHAVIIATGASANYLGLPSEDRFKNQGVSACAVCDGALPRFRGKELIVVGGGDSAVEEADYLTKHAAKVYMIHRRDALRASKIMADRALNNPKIEVLWNTQVAEVLGDDDHGMTGVRIASTAGEPDREIAATGMFVAIGHTPNTKFLNGQLDTNAKGYVTWTVPFRTNTSIEGVFAAGDVSDDYYRQACTAAGTGCMAALDAERWLASKGL